MDLIFMIRKTQVFLRVFFETLTFGAQHYLP